MIFYLCFLSLFTSVYSIQKIGFNDTFNQLDYQNCAQGICSGVCVNMTGREGDCSDSKQFGFGVYQIYSRVCCAALQDGALMNGNRVDFSLIDGVTAFSRGVSNGVESFKYAYSQGTGKGFIFQKRSTFAYPIFVAEPQGGSFDNSPRVTLTCEAVVAASESVVEISWERNKKVLDDKTGTTIVIREPGSYRCKASAVGGCSTLSRLVVIGGQAGHLTSTSTTTSLSSNLVSTIPTTDEELEGTVDRLEEECRPGRLYKDGYTSFTPSFGAYQCMRKGGEGGGEEQETTLVVKVRPLKITAVGFRSKTFEEEGEVQLKCNTTGYPEQLLQWSQNGGPITSPLLMWRGAGEVVIERAVMEDTGEYRCGIPQQDGAVEWSEPMKVDIQVRDRITNFNLNSTSALMVGDTLLLQITYQMSKASDCKPVIKLGSRELKDSPDVTVEHSVLLDITTAQRHLYSVTLRNITLTDGGTAIASLERSNGEVLHQIQDMVLVFSRPKVDAGWTDGVVQCNYTDIDFLESFDNDLECAVVNKKGEVVYSSDESYDPDDLQMRFTHSYNTSSSPSGKMLFRCQGTYKETGYTFVSPWVGSGTIGLLQNGSIVVFFVVFLKELM